MLFFVDIVYIGIQLDAKTQDQIRVKNEAEKSTVEFYSHIFSLGNKDLKN